MPPLHELVHFAPSLRLLPSAARVWADAVFGFCLAACSIAALCYALWAWSRANALSAEVWKRRGLRPGPLLLPGVAQPLQASDDKNAPLIQLTIHQAGRQFEAKSGPYVRWTEVFRQLRDGPFLLRTDAGDDVHVEPSGHVELVDRLEPPLRQSADKRLRIARIVPGERVWIRGVLTPASRDDSGPYRGGGGDGLPLLRPPPGGALLISSQAVDSEHRSLARLHLAFAALIAGALAVCQGYVFRPYHALRSRGEVTQAMVVEHRRWVTYEKHATVQHYGFRLEFDCPTGRAMVDEETSAEAFFATADGEDVPITFLLEDPTVSQIGRPNELGVSHARLVAPVVGSLALLALYVFALAKRRPWWRKRKVTETEKGALV
jgi:hypothetical protein